MFHQEEKFAAELSAAVASIAADSGRVEIHFDVESTSLRGVGFALGGFVRQGKRELMEFALLARSEATLCGEWVQQNVLPHLADLPTVETVEDIYAAYGRLFNAVKSRVMELHGIKPWDTTELRKRFVVVVDNGFPVEAGFEAACWRHLLAQASEPDRFAVEMGGAYMPCDISTALDVLGYNPDLPRAEAAEALGVTGPKHNPVIDARQSAAVFDAARRGDPALDKYRL